MFTTKTGLSAATFAVALMAMGGSAFAHGSAYTHWHPPETNDPAPEVETPYVCFYTKVDYKGKYYCEAGQRTVNKVKEPWRYKVKSIQVLNGAIVHIYRGDYRSGVVKPVTSNIRRLDQDFYNHVWSYRTSIK